MSELEDDDMLFVTTHEGAPVSRVRRVVGWGGDYFVAIYGPRLYCEHRHRTAKGADDCYWREERRARQHKGRRR